MFTWNLLILHRAFKLIIIIEGLAALNADIDGEQTIALFKEGDSLGEMALISKAGTHQYGLEVDSPKLKTLELSIYNWTTIVKNNPKIANKIYKKTKGVAEVYVKILSQIGRPIDQPMVTDIELILEKGNTYNNIKNEIENIVNEQLSEIKQISDEIVEGKIVLF